MRRTLLAAGTALAVATAAPPFAAADTAAPEAAEGCIKDIQAFDRELGGAGYGLTGPSGYAAWPQTAPTPAAAPTAFGYLTAPREQMITLRNAAFVLAMNGKEEACRLVLDEMRGAFEAYRQQVAEGETVDSEEVARWRAEWLAAASPVSELDSPVGISEVLGADLRNLRDEDLGDVENVLLSDEGEIEYVTVARGGFLGIGGDTVAIPWHSLRVTPDPYSDTLVLPVDEEAVLENAPTVDEEQLTADGWQAGVDAYWQENVRPAE